MKTDEEVKNEFRSNEVELSDEELENIKKGYGKVMENLEKLDDNTLKELSGGGFWDFCRTNGQVMRNKFTDVIVQSAPRIIGLVLDGAEAVVKVIYKKASSPSQSDSTTPPQAAPSSNEKTAGTVAAVVALSAGAGIIYKNRRAIKKWWNS